MKSEMTPVDASSRNPLTLLLVSGVLWLVASGVLGLLASIQLHSPSFLSGCALLTYGRLSAVAETAFVYGWLANAGLALVLWVLGRLSGEPLRGQNWAIAGALFWNLGVTGALVGVAVGDGTGFALLALPSLRPADPPLLLRGDRGPRPPRLVRPPARGLLRLPLVRRGGPLRVPLDPLDRARDALLGARSAACSSRSWPAGTPRPPGRSGSRRWRCRRPTTSSRR